MISLNSVRTFSRRVRGFFDAPLDAGAAPLELLQATLDELETKVQPSGRGSRVFRRAQKSAFRGAAAA